MFDNFYNTSPFCYIRYFMRNKLPHYIMIICIIYKYKYTKVHDKFFVILVISLVPLLHFFIHFLVLSFFVLYFSIQIIFSIK